MRIIENHMEHVKVSNDIAYQPLNNEISSDEEEEEKGEIVSEEAIRNINLSTARGPGEWMSVNCPARPKQEFKEMKIASAHSCLDDCVDDEQEGP